MTVTEPSLHSLHPLGRALLIKCEGPLGGPPPEKTIQEARSAHSRILLIDATHAEYADSDGLRWLLALRSLAGESGLDLRIAARVGGNVWRNIDLLRADLSLVPSVHEALHGPSRSDSSTGWDHGKGAAYARQA